MGKEKHSEVKLWPSSEKSKEPLTKEAVEKLRSENLKVKAQNEINFPDLEYETKGSIRIQKPYQEPDDISIFFSNKEVKRKFVEGRELTKEVHQVLNQALSEAWNKIMDTHAEGNEQEECFQKGRLSAMQDFLIPLREKLEGIFETQLGELDLQQVIKEENLSENASLTPKTIKGRTGNPIDHYTFKYMAKLLDSKEAESEIDAARIAVRRFYFPHIVFDGEKKIVNKIKRFHKDYNKFKNQK